MCVCFVVLLFALRLCVLVLCVLMSVVVLLWLRCCLFAVFDCFVSVVCDFSLLRKMCGCGLCAVVFVFLWCDVCAFVVL